MKNLLSASAPEHQGTPTGSFKAALCHHGSHLSEDQLLPAEGACVLCGFSGNRKIVLRLQDAPPVYLLECPCGCASASRMPREEVLKDYYSRYYAPLDGTATFDDTERFSRHLYRALAPAAKPSMRILDFGGGVDALISRSVARHFLQHGAREIEIALVDYNAACPKDYGDGITVHCYQELPKSAEGFDAVIASAIVEHIPYPREIVLGLLNSLSPGSLAYFRTPVMSSLINFAARFGATIDFTYPMHLHDMGQPCWENLLTTLNLSRFRLVRSRPSLVETAFLSHPVRTMLAHLFKLPWFALGRRYSMVGGWEAVFQRVPSEIP